LMHFCVMHNISLYISYKLRACFSHDPVLY